MTPGIVIWRTIESKRMKLTEKKCRPVSGPGGLLDKITTESYLAELNEGWKVDDNQMIWKEFPFLNFSLGMQFAQKIADLAEAENHHPDLMIKYTMVRVELSTHDVGGLSENDFILAAKIDQI